MMPFESKSQNRLEMTNEMMILFTGYFVAISVGWNLPAQHRDIVGFVSTFFITIVILFNVARWLVFMIKYARMNLDRLANKRKRQRTNAIHADK